MYPVTLEMSRQEILVAHYLAGVRIEEVTGGDKNVSKPITYDERHAQDKASILGEMAVSHNLNVYWTGITRDQPDVGGEHEVRSVREEHKNLILRPTDKEEEVRWYLVYVYEPFCTIRGWAFTSEIKAHGRWCTPEGESPYWLFFKDQLHREMRDRRV